MYAIDEIAGQQFKVQKDQKLYVHRLNEERGANVEFTQVLLVDADGKIKVGDLFWLEGKKPIPELEAEYGNGATATAVVKSVSYVNLTIAITLTRNKDKVVQ